MLPELSLDVDPGLGGDLLSSCCRWLLLHLIGQELVVQSWIRGDLCVRLFLHRSSWNGDRRWRSFRIGLSRALVVHGRERLLGNRFQRLENAHTVERRSIEDLLLPD